jgi:hypothetical protein
MFLFAAMMIATFASIRLTADIGMCGGTNITVPFTDVAGNIFFCEIAEAFFSGLTYGTTATTFSPGSTVTRDQMTAFTTRTLDQSLNRGKSRAALGRWWTPTPQYDNGIGVTPIGVEPAGISFDGADLWVADAGGDTVTRVRASDGRVLEKWTGAINPVGVLVALGRVFVTGQTFAGKLYMIDPSQTAGAVTTVADLGNSPGCITFDGSRIWVGYTHPGGGLSIITPKATFPWDVTNVTADPDFFFRGFIYDGFNIWATDFGDRLLKLDSNGAILATVNILGNPALMTFDGTNIWVPRLTGNAVSVVRASTGEILANFTGNGLNFPFAAAFDGERILITNQNGHSVSLWKATDFTPLGNFPTGTQGRPDEVCSDGLNFWITMVDSGVLARF